jgi:UPF0755 protein
MKLRRFLLTVAVVLLAGAGLFYFSLRQRYAGFREPIFLDIAKGTSTVRLAELLEDKGVVRLRWQFLLARALRPRVKLQAGEYRFAEPASTLEVYDRLARGDIFYYELVVPEGSNVFDIAASLAQLGVIGANRFLDAAADPSMIRDLDPKAPTLEGYLFPSTYRITRHTSAAALCRMMTGQFRRVWKKLAAKADVHRTVTLASLVEKETAVAGERPLVASVFENRLRNDMRLECDPTTIYAALLEERYRGTIYQSDLASRNRYNTYQHAGLPPGPIANPGRQSLRAALEPADTEYLFFVARPDGSGAHQFSRTLKAHQRAVGKYRRGKQKTVEKTQPRGAPRAKRYSNRG